MGLGNFLRRKSSKEIAKDRLKILLISDRVNCSPEMMEMIKTDIAKVISKYMKIDAQSMEIQITKTSTRDWGKPLPCMQIFPYWIYINCNYGR